MKSDTDKAWDAYEDAYAHLDELGEEAVAQALAAYDVAVDAHQAALLDESRKGMKEDVLCYIGKSSLCIKRERE